MLFAYVGKTHLKPYLAFSLFLKGGCYIIFKWTNSGINRTHVVLAAQAYSEWH